MPLSQDQKRLVSMLDYLEHWDRLNRTPVFDVAAHQGGFLVWEWELAGLPGVHLNLADEAGEVWLKVDRLRPLKPPDLPKELVPWVAVKDDPNSSPTHRESLPNPDEPRKPLVFEEQIALITAFNAYMSGAWRQWAESERPRRRSIAIYDKLFSLLQVIETEGAETAMELVWGIGVALWEKGGKAIRYPLLSRLTEIDPVGVDMAIGVRPREVPPILETDPYANLEVPGLPAFEKGARAIIDHPDSDIRPFDGASYEQLLATAAGSLDRHGRYWPREPDYQAGRLPAICDTLAVTNVWVVFARRKSTNFLVEDIRRLRARVESGPLPDGAPKVLVQTPEGAVPERPARMWRGISSAGSWIEPMGSTPEKPIAESAPEELYFPKHFNPEQVQIVDRLSHADGVVVQGPPGTGKTHTIANIICHCLAEGKNVLVTSKGESALTAVRQLLPAQVQNLTVSLLTNEREGLKQLELSVSKITSQVTSLSKEKLRHDIEQSRRALNRLHGEVAEIDRELADWARLNIDPVPAPLDGLRPEALARHVVKSEKHYSWFPDELDGRPEHEVAFSPDDIDQLREARYAAGKDISYLNSVLPEAGTLPSISQIRDLHCELLDFDAIAGAIEERKVARFRAVAPEHLKTATALRDLLQEAARIRVRLMEPWPDWLRRQFHLPATAQPAWSALAELASELSALVGTRRQLLGMAVEWRAEWDSDEDLVAAVENSAAGKRPFGVSPFGRKTARQRYEQLRLNGQLPKSSEDWQWIQAHFTLRRRTRTLVCRWNSLTSECPAPVFPQEPLDALRMAEEVLDQIQEAQRWAKEIVPSLNANIREVFVDTSPDGLADDPPRLQTLAEAIELRLRRHRLEAACEERNRLRSILVVSELPLSQKADRFLSEWLGNPKREAHAIENGWQAVLDEIDRIRRLRPTFDTVKRVCARIAGAGARIWADKLRTEPAGEGAFNWTPSDWAAAWKWSRQFGYLRRIAGHERVTTLAKKRAELENRIGRTYEELVEQMTWLKLRETLDQDRGLMAALQLYMSALHGIGKGTGVRAERNRQAARRAMRTGYGAVRCWIMPHWRVSESLPSELALFDLVIVDEASQSDLWALPALLRAKKLLIVGDNKQVSPSAIGVREADIRQLYARFLKDLPFGSVLSPEKSIYELGSVMFASDLVRLREHFRCVEPIIEFSNRNFYGGEMRCLRIPTSDERIVPPLVDVFVTDGAREAKTVKINRAEAQAIVNEIKTITNPDFVGRSIGVVSLLGSDQARFVFDLLVRELGEELILRHRIRCGDAMTFQGREADIVFISMVSDAETVRALSGDTYEQRFNVAASRARDRLYVYRSFRREDLKENDLRARLLDHLTSPLRRDPEKKGRERCESEFERQVFDRLNAAGYRVTPQVPAAGYRIDLVVEGHSGRRLAVECDGDRYHSPEVWLEDLHRQRTLERAGWKFWRCWASSFIRDPDSCMLDLFATLENVGIGQIGGEGLDLSEVVEYREVSGVSDDVGEPTAGDSS
jgi:very-short-patch-repair endonuclease